MRIVDVAPDGAVELHAHITRPLDGTTVPPNFRAKGDYEYSESTLTASIDGNGFSQQPPVTQVPFPTWYADFTNVPCGTSYALSIDADLPEEESDGILINVCIGLRKITYKWGKFEEITITNPEIPVRVKHTARSADGDMATPSSSRAALLTIHSPFTVAVTFLPAPAEVSGLAINKAAGESYQAKITPYPGGLLDQFGSKTWNFTFDVPPGEYTLRFIGDTLEAETDLRVVEGRKGTLGHHRHHRQAQLAQAVGSIPHVRADSAEDR